MADVIGVCCARSDGSMRYYKNFCVSNQRFGFLFTYAEVRNDCWFSICENFLKM